jgi:hypothetical protein
MLGLPTAMLMYQPSMPKASSTRPLPAAKGVNIVNRLLEISVRAQEESHL